MDLKIRPLERPFELVSDYAPAGDQPAAIETAVRKILAGEKDIVLLGVTGSGKTFTVANIAQQLGWPVLVLSHNKTLAAQLYQEFKEFFPKNAVEYFVSYYDYYQPEAYLPTTDTYIEKDASINQEIEKLRLRATTSLLTRRDIVVVSTVSCIYGLGSPQAYLEKVVELEPGQNLERDDFLRALVDMQYSRNDIDLKRSTFRVRGDVVEVWPAYDDRVIRVEFLGDEIERIRIVDSLTGNTIDEPPTAAIFPARHYQTGDAGLADAIQRIKDELADRLKELSREGKLLEYERLKSRVNYDLEMLTETGYCSGIENYSRLMEDRPPGSPPSTLLDFFPKPFLLVLDESHVTIPQIGGMSEGDRSRKTTLVEHGFRLPSAVDNRPLRWHEFEERMPATLFVSATPAGWEMRRTGGEVVELVARPTGLLDPEIEVRPVTGQIDDLLEEIRKRRALKERVLVTTLTKRMAEDLTDFLQKAGVPVRYMHSEVHTLERSELVRGLRAGDFDVLVGINLLREGLDLPEVSLVAILDADKEGFLRSTTSLIQTSGRASRNLNGKVIFYADRMTDSMKACMAETARRRIQQKAFNDAHGIVPQQVNRKIHERLALAPDPVEELLEGAEEPSWKDVKKGRGFQPKSAGKSGKSSGKTSKVVSKLPYEAPGGMDAEAWDNPDALAMRMHEAAASLDFERAARLRDRIRDLGA
jgi:excinuclease ABC subunit B